MITSAILAGLVLLILVATVTAIRRDGYGTTPPPPSDSAPTGSHSASTETMARLLP